MEIKTADDLLFVITAVLTVVGMAAMCAFPFVALWLVFKRKKQLYANILHFFGVLYDLIKY